MTDTIAKMRRRLEDWLFEAALPLWWESGADHAHGGYHELLGLDGKPVADGQQRARVQGRQSYVYATAGLLGWSGPWKVAAQHGLDYLNRCYKRKDGLYRTLVAADGSALDDTAMVYDQAFVLLAMATLRKAVPERTELSAAARALADTLMRTRRHAAGGFVESGPFAFQSNPHMHLLEATLAWHEVEPDGPWLGIADEIVALALDKFLGRDSGLLLEFFDAAWKPHPGAAGRIIEPGHQFEWAWLLERWSRIRDDQRGSDAATRLFELGLRGVDRARGAAVNEVTDSFDNAAATARLWSQTEYLKAALILLERASGAERARLLEEISAALDALWRYLDVPTKGLWRDKLRPDDSFAQEPAPASSFYHIICAIGLLRESQL